MVIENLFGAERAASEAVSASSKPAVSPLSDRLAQPADRLAAAIADVLIFTPLGTLAIAPFRHSAMLAQISGSREDWARAAVGALASLSVAWIFYCVATALWLGCSPGKRFFGLQVVTLWDESSQVRPFALFLRSLVTIFEILAFGVPWLAVFSNARRRPLHDRIADTVVIAGPERRRASTPGRFEAQAAGGAYAAIFLIFLLLAAAVLRQGSREFSAAESATRSLEERGLLCAKAEDLRDEWPPETRPTRLQAALTLYAAEEIDKNCLDREAEHAAWQPDGDRQLAYAAKALARSTDRDLAHRYTEKACAAEPLSDACLTASLAILEDPPPSANVADSAHTEGRAPASAADTPEEARAAVLDLALMQRLQKQKPSGKENPLYLDVFAIRHRLFQKDYSTALAAIEAAPPRRALAAFFDRERIKALWGLDRRSEARAAWKVAFFGAADSVRPELASWACEAELEQGCNGEAKTVCRELAEQATRENDILRQPRTIVAFVRGEECRSGPRWNAHTARAIMPTNDGKTYVDAIARLRSASREQAVDTLRTLAEESDDGSAIYYDAESRLVQMALTAAELQPVRDAWSRSAPSEPWLSLGRRLTVRFAALGAFERALKIAAIIRAEDPFNPSAQKTVRELSLAAGSLATRSTGALTGAGSKAE